MKDRKWIFGLDSLRIILAVIVLLSHLDTYPLLHQNHYPKILYGILDNSFVGVCAVIAFFIISGIVIHFPYADNKEFNPYSFLIKRYIRLGIPMFIIYIIAKMMNMPISHLPFWSLYCEIIYYSIYPLILYLTKKKIKIIFSLFLITFVLSYIIILIEGNALKDFIHQNKDLNGDYWQLGIPITALLGLPNWILGVILAQKFVDQEKNIHFSQKKIYTIRFIIFFVSVICSIGRFHLSISYTLSLNVFGLLAAYWIWIEINYWVKHKTNKVLELAGKFSYSVYICHALILFTINSYMKLNWITLFLEIIGSLVFSYIFYLAVERPSHRLARKIN